MELTFNKHKDAAYTVLADGQEIGGVQGTSYSVNGWKFAVWLAFRGTVPLAAEEGGWPVQFFSTRQEAAEALYQEWLSRCTPASSQSAKALFRKSISSDTFWSWLECRTEDYMHLCKDDGGCELGQYLSPWYRFSPLENGRILVEYADPMDSEFDDERDYRQGEEEGDESPKKVDLGPADPDQAEKKFLEELRDLKPTGSQVRSDLIYTSLGYALRSELEDTGADACLPSCERCGEPANDTDGERRLCGDCWQHDALVGRIEVSPETLEDLAWED